jgi:hypothetical protein
MVQKFGRRVLIEWNDRDIESPSRPLVGFSKSHRPSCEKGSLCRYDSDLAVLRPWESTYLFRPLDSAESGARGPDSLQPYAVESNPD